MQRWEYAVADFTKLGNAVPELDRLGGDGWEAVGLVSTWGAGWRFVHPIVLLKRPRPESARYGTPDAAAARRRWVWTIASLSRVRGIRGQLGGTVNDVLRAAVTRGFRDLLLERRELADGLVVRSLRPRASAAWQNC